MAAGLPSYATQPEHQPLKRLSSIFEKRIGSVLENCTRFNFIYRYAITSGFIHVAEPLIGSGYSSHIKEIMEFFLKRN